MLIRALLMAALVVGAGVPLPAQPPPPPTAPDQRPHPCAQFAHAIELSASSDHPAALAEWTHLAATHPTEACIENRLGLELLHSGDSAAAIAHLGKAIALDPKDAAPHNSLGVALIADAMHAQHDRAEREFKRAIELNPQYAEAQTNLGDLYRDEGDAAQAEQRFRAAMASDPRFIKAYLNLARTLAEQSRLTEADAILAKALAIDATNRETQRFQKQVRSMIYK